MAKLPKGITLRSDGRYMWRFQYEGISYSGYCKKLSDAEKAMRDKKFLVEHGLASKDKAVILDAWFDEWMQEYKRLECKDSTLNIYQNVYNRYIKPEFGMKQIRKIQPEMIQRFVNRIAKEYSKSVSNTVNFLLYDSLQQATRNGIISRNPMENTVTPKAKERKKKGALSEEAETQFLNASRSSRYYPVFRLASLTGMRIGECLGLCWKDVDFEKGEIHIRHTLSYISGRGQYLDTPKSTASCRSIPMGLHSELYNLLKEQRKNQNCERLQAGQFWKPLDGLEDIVFTSDHGTPYFDVNIRKEQRAIIAKLKEQGVEIENCTFHTLRHCFATRAIENGMSPKVLQAILGHTSFSMTMDLYCDVMEESKRTEMEKIMAAL